MNTQQMLTESIEYGIKNGWDGLGVDFDKHRGWYLNSLADIINDNSWWKAICGEENVCKYCGDTHLKHVVEKGYVTDYICEECGRNICFTPAWKFHQQQCVSLEKQNEQIKYIHQLTKGEEK